jgi:tetratricopeptide (TPR) repeat protein
LKLPYYGHAKAFFALAAMLPFCAFAVAGFELWTKQMGSVVGIALLALLGLWLINDFSAFWIRQDAPHTRLILAINKFFVSKDDAAPDFKRLIDSDPLNSIAAEYLARAELKAGRSDRFLAAVEQAIANNSINGELASLAAKQLVLLKRSGDALEFAKRAAHNAPDNEAIAQTWLNLAFATRKDTEVVAAATWFLRDNPGSLQAHKILAESLNRLGKTNAAATQLSIGHAKEF